MTHTRYIIGFLLSLAVTCVSFWLAWIHITSHHVAIAHTTLAAAILLLAGIQLAIQLRYFLHLGHESKARDILSLILAGFLVVFIVIGSLWIMANLDQNHGLPYHGDITPQTSTD